MFKIVKIRYGQGKIFRENPKGIDKEVILYLFGIPLFIIRSY
ncbi:MAG: hypothetical protein R2837_11340 [Aliarcobacter sp.]